MKKEKELKIRKFVIVGTKGSEKKYVRNLKKDSVVWFDDLNMAKTWLKVYEDKLVNGEGFKFEIEELKQ